MAAGSALFGLAAGALSTLSPCVLPLLPLVLGGAAAAHRLGALALGAGLVSGFVAVGMFVALVGFGIGLDGEVFRLGAAVLLGAVGVVLLSAGLQARFALATAGLADAANRVMARMGGGLAAQFGIGLVLGAVWSPCVGPTLGAASTLAAQGRDLAEVGLVMLAFGVGAALPLVAVSLLSRAALMRVRGRMMAAGSGGRLLLGGAAVMVALLIVSGLDHRLEAALVAASPEWLTDLTTRF
jgi:cytochrome c biogenesis protein CcdA